MAVRNGKKTTAFPGIDIITKSAFKDAVIRFDQVNTAPTTTSGHRYLYVNSSNQLIFDSGSTTLNLSTVAASGGSTLDSVYDGGRTVSVDSGAVTLNGIDEDTAVLAITGDGDSAGALLTFSHTTNTRNDVTGTGSTWSVTGQGAAVFTAIAMADNELITFGTGSDATIGWNATVLNIAGVVDFDDNVTLAASATITQTGVAGSAVYTITAGDVVWSDSSLAITDADNAETVTVINNTATTIGASASAGVIQVESTSLTSGAAINVQLTEGTLNGGFYYSGWDATAAARVFSVGENGVITITGAGGADSLTITNGDVNLPDASLTIVDADNAATLSVTNDTATSASVFVFAGSGAFTGSTTTSFATLTASGLTSGTVLYLPAAALTTGQVIDIVAGAATDAVLFDITGGAANMTATGRLARLAMGAATVGRALEMSTTGVYTGAGLLTVTADSATTSGASAGEGVVAISADGLTTGTALRVESASNEVMTSGRLGLFVHSAVGTTVAAKTGAVLEVTSSITESGTSTQDFDMVSFTRTSVHDTAGTLTATGSVLRLENVATETGATLSDSTIGLEIVMGATGTGDGIQVTQNAVAGIAIDLVGTALTTGKGVDLSDLNALTSGIGLHLASSATAITGAGRLLYSNHTGATGTSAVLNEFASAANDETVVLRVTASDLLAAGVLLDLSAAAMETGKVIDMSNLDAITTGKAIHVDATGITHTSGVLVHIDSASTALTGAGRLLRVDHTGASASSAVVAEFASAAADETVVLRVTASAALAAGVLLDLSASSVTTGTVLDMGGLDALTTGTALNIVSNSSSSGTRTLVQITNDNTAATGTTPLNIQQDAPTSTNYWKVQEFTTTSGTVTLWMGNGTTGNGNLSGTAGDILFNGGSNKPEYCTGTTNWTALV